MYIVKYSGSFGFIKPWSALRDTKTKSNDFLTPSVLMGIEHKLFDVIDPYNMKIKRHRLQFDSISYQQEQTSSIDHVITKTPKSKEVSLTKNKSIINRGVLINPVLYLCFDNKVDAEEASHQHIVLCRNEDLMFAENLEYVDSHSFDNDNLYSGNESFICDSDTINSIYCGLNKYTETQQYCTIKRFGTVKNLV
jgi:hypothetical protein